MFKIKAGEIAGGIEVSDDVITYNGNKFTVGGDTKYNMRTKFLCVKHIPINSDTFEKQLLKVINLNLPLTFGKKLNFMTPIKKINLLQT